MRHADFRLSTSPVEERFIQLSTEVFCLKWIKLNLASKGPFWCSNLCVEDPTLLVPLLVGTFFAANVWISGIVLLWSLMWHPSTGNRLAKATEHLPSRGQTIFTAVLYSISALMVSKFYDGRTSLKSNFPKRSLWQLISPLQWVFTGWLVEQWLFFWICYWWNQGCNSLQTTAVWYFLTGFVAWWGSHLWSKSLRDLTINWEKIFTKQLEWKPNKSVVPQHASGSCSVFNRYAAVRLKR